MRLFSALAVAAASVSTIVAAQTERDLDSHEHGAASMNIALDDGTVFLELDTPWNNLVGFEHAPGNDEQQAMVDNALAQLNEPSGLFSFEGTSCTVADIDLENGLASADSHDDHHDDEHAHGDEKHDDHDDDAHGDEEHDDHDDDAHGDEKHDDHDDDAHGDEKHDDHDDDAHGDEKHDDHDDDAHGDEKHDDHDDDAHGDDKHDDHDDHDDDAHGDHDDHDESTHSSLLATYSFNCDNVARLSAIDVKLLALWSGFEELDVQLIGPSGQAQEELTPGNSRLDISQVQ